MSAETELEEITIEISPAEPEVWSEPSASAERLLAAIRERILHLEACRLKSRYARTDKEAKQIRALESELHGLKTKLNKWSGFGANVDESLLFAQCAFDMAGDSDFDQHELERSVTTKLDGHRLRYVTHSEVTVKLLESALSRSRSSAKGETLFWDVSKIQLVFPDVPPRLISPAKPAVTRTVRVKQPVPDTRDVVRDATVEQLEMLATDDSRPDIQLRASQRLTDLAASQIKGRSAQQPMFRSCESRE